MVLEKLILSQYQSILYSFGVERRLKPAIIVVSDSVSYWGRWCSLSRSIEISKKLLLNYDWDVVVNVLKHEIAHQLVDELFLGAESEKLRPHGPAFIRACDLLGVAEWARSAAIDLVSVAESESHLKSWSVRRQFEAEHPVFRKIQKLLSLSESPNLHEAELAAQRARELHRKYLNEMGFDSEKQISGSDAEKAASAYDTLYLTQNKARMDRVSVSLHSLLQSHFNVDCIYTDIVSVKRQRLVKAVALLGRRKNLVMAEYTYEFLSRTLETLWLQKRKSGMNSSHQHSYKLGVIKGFRDCLDQAERESLYRTDAQTSSSASNANQSLQAFKNSLAVEKAKLRDYVESQFPKTRKTSSRSGGVYLDSFQKGMSDGSKLKLRTPLSGQGKSSSGSRLLLG